MNSTVKVRVFCATEADFVDGRWLITRRRITECVATDHTGCREDIRAAVSSVVRRLRDQDELVTVSQGVYEVTDKLRQWAEAQDPEYGMQWGR